MELNLSNVNIRREKVYFVIILIFALAIWIFVGVSIVGIVFCIGIAFLVWLSNGLFVAALKSSCVFISESQLPQLHKTFAEVSAKLGVEKLPGLYILQSQGHLNAFAMRHAGRDFVVIFSEILDTYGADSDEIRFLIGHELGHIKSKHVLKLILLGPGLMLPLLGPAYSRACETSCDRYGAYSTLDAGSGARAMMVLAGGREAHKIMNAEAFSEQYRVNRGFFVSWYELISGYPTLSQRVANLIAIRDHQEPTRQKRHPLSYLFALFTLGGPGEAFGQLMITIAIVGLLAAVAIPNFLRAKMTANQAIAGETIAVLDHGAKQYQKKFGRYPKDGEELRQELNRKDDICGSEVKGYLYKCTLAMTDYRFEARPTEPGTTGTIAFFADRNGLSEIDVTVETDEPVGAEEFVDDADEFAIEEEEPFETESLRLTTPDFRL